LKRTSAQHKFTKTDEYEIEFFLRTRSSVCVVHRAKEHDEYMDAEVIPDSDQLSSMYPVSLLP